MKTTCAIVFASVLLINMPAMADDQWQPVTGADTLRDFMSGLKAERTLPGGGKQTAEYKADGTGVLHSWGDRFKRTWEVKDEDKVCFQTGKESACATLERNKRKPNLFRVKNLTTGKLVEFTVTEKTASAKGKPSDVGNEGGTAAVSAEEMAAKLANPNAPLASFTFKLQYRTFEGSLPGAHDQSSTTVLFQPSFPFKLDNGDVIFFRPAIPLLFDQPVFNTNTSSFDSESGMGDISFDLAYGRTTKTGMLYAFGIISSLPTATEDSLGNDRYTLGPEFLIGKITKTYVIGAFPNHQWDVGGSGNAEVNLTNMQLFLTYLPGGGWNIGTSPILSYNHETSESTIPLNLTIGKTVIWDGRPWKLSMEINHYIEQPEAFGPEWMVSFNVAPVVENVFAKWFK